MSPEPPLNFNSGRGNPPLRGRTFQLVDCRPTWGEDRVYFHDDSGQLARLPLQWTDVVPDDPTVEVGADRE
jgi:hypothetical protein